MQTIFGLVLPAPVLWVLALLFVLALVAIFGLILRRLGGRRASMKGQGGGRARQPRLGVIDIYDLDRQRQLVLLRRDNVEHLVMIGGPSDVVVETNIVRGGVRPAAGSAQDGAGQDRFDGEAVHVPAPPAAQVPMAAPAPVIAQAAPVAGPAPLSSASAVPVPVRPAAAPVATAPAMPEPPAGTQVATGIDAVIRSEVAPRTDIPARGEAKSVFPLESAPAPKPPAADLDDMARQLEQALKRPFAAVRASAPATAVAAAVTAAVAEAKAPAATPEAQVQDVKAPDVEVPHVKVPDIKVPDIKAMEVSVPEPKVPELKPSAVVTPDPMTPVPVAPAPMAQTQPPMAENPDSAPARAASSFEAFMDEQLKAAVSAMPAAVQATPVVPAARTAAGTVPGPDAGMPDLPDAIAAELQAAMVDSLKSVEPARSTEASKALPPEADARPAEGRAPAASRADAKVGEARDSKTDEAAVPGNLRPQSTQKPEAPAARPLDIAARSAEAKPAEAKPAETKPAETRPTEKPATEKPAAEKPAVEKAAVEKTAAGGKPDAAGESDPFSIDAIEMEFARLLGRDTKPKT